MLVLDVGLVLSSTRILLAAAIGCCTACGGWREDSLGKEDAVGCIL